LRTSITAIRELSYVIRLGTPPNSSKARRCPSMNVSVHSLGKACTNIAPEEGSVMTKIAAFVSLPAVRIVASPKSTWASPGGCDSGRNTSRRLIRYSRTASFTTVSPPV
jgi:hypothetical protein